jgi:hypothetical protein
MHFILGRRFQVNPKKQIRVRQQRVGIRNTSMSLVCKLPFVVNASERIMR